MAGTERTRRVTGRKPTETRELPVPDLQRVRGENAIRTPPATSGLYSALPPPPATRRQGRSGPRPGPAHRRGAQRGLAAKKVQTKLWAGPGFAPRPAAGREEPARPGRAGVGVQSVGPALGLRAPQVGNTPPRWARLAPGAASPPRARGAAWVLAVRPKQPCLCSCLSWPVLLLLLEAPISARACQSSPLLRVQRA